ncbi:MAG: LytR C-terminal domain-containing protein [bacterium]|nr:LytR C-terminal domain-containing protein [bacterium]
MSDDNNSRKDKEEDQVAEAYESISKKLENLREDKEVPEDEDIEEKSSGKDEDKDEEPEEEEIDEKHLDPLPGTGDKEEDPDPKPTFKPQDDDPLDDESPAEDEDSQPDKEETDDYDEPKVQKNSGPEEDLDDLAQEDEGHNIPNLKPSHEESTFPKKPDYASEISFSKPSYAEPNPSNYFNRHATDRPAKRGNIWHLIILILIGLAVIGGTVYLLKYQFGGAVTPQATPSPSPTVLEPTPEPTPSFERSKFKVRVLNGTTTTGLAKTVSDKLKELGYQIDKTGNAPKQDFKSSVVKVKTSAAGLGEELVKDLGSEYPASVSGELKDTDAADAEVVIGK